MNWLKLFGCFVIVGLWMSCLNGYSAAGEKLSRVYVETMAAPDTVTSDSVTVVLKGNLPHPGYELVRVEEQRKADTIRLVPLAKVRSGVFIQVLVPFEIKHTIHQLKLGTNLIIVEGYKAEIQRVVVFQES